MAAQTTTRWSMTQGFDDDQFDQWRDLLETRTGMRYTRDRRSLFSTQIKQRMLEVGFGDLQAYYHAVTAGGAAAESEWQTLLDYLTVQETRFFRDPQALELVTKHVRTQWARDDHPFQAWSVGCATGEEAYSLAMILAEQARNSDHTRHYSVTGSDISAPAIHKARLGRYRARLLTPVPRHLRARYFSVDENSDQADICPQLANSLCFTRMNVLDLNEAPLSNMDLVYCQNLLIYFPRWRRRELVSQLVTKLRPGGLLVLGPGELTGYTHPDLISIPNRQCLAFLRKHRTEREG